MPVSPDPSPTNDPENIEPDIANVFVKSTITFEPDTMKEPVISPSPSLVPSHSDVAVMPVRLLPSP